MNKCIFVGFLGKKGIELKETPSGKKVATYSLSLSKQKKGEYEFVNMVTWGNDAEFLKNNESKIKKLAVVARVETRNYEKDGAKRYITEFVTEPYGIEIVEWNNEGENKPSTPNNDFFPADNDDDIPF